MRPHLLGSLMFALMAAALVHRVLCFAPASVDEPGWISSGFLTWQLVTGAAPPPRWAEVFNQLHLGPFGNMNPPVGKFLIGAAVALARQPGDPVHYLWEWPRDYAFNLAAGNVPPDALLAAVRGWIALSAVAVLILAYLVAREVTHDAPWIPLLAPVILFSSPTFQYCATRVFTDVPQMFFTLMGIWLTLRWLRGRRDATLAGALVCVGLACATKFSAGALVIATVIAMGLVRAPLPVRTLRVLAAAVVPAVVFVAVNPYLWPQPLSGMLNLVHQWSHQLRGQRADPAVAASVVTNRLRAAGLVLWKGCLLAHRGRGSLVVPEAWYSVLVPSLTFAGVAALIMAVFRRQPGRGILRRRPVAVTLAVCLCSASRRYSLPMGRWSFGRCRGRLNTAGRRRDHGIKKKARSGALWRAGRPAKAGRSPPGPPRRRQDKPSAFLPSAFLLTSAGRRLTMNPVSRRPSAR